MSSNGGIEALISTIGASKAIAYFSLDQSYYGMVYSTILNAINPLIMSIRIEQITQTHLICLCIASVIVYAGYLCFQEKISPWNIFQSIWNKIKTGSNTSKLKITIESHRHKVCITEYLLSRART